MESTSSVTWQCGIVLALGGTEGMGLVHCSELYSVVDTVRPTAGFPEPLGCRARGLDLARAGAV